MSIVSLFRSGFRHAKRAEKLANESMMLAGKSMEKVTECYIIAASIPSLAMEAARPDLEIAQLNADLAQAWVNDAERYAKEARRKYAECLGYGLRQPVSVN